MGRKNIPFTDKVEIMKARYALNFIIDYYRKVPIDQLNNDQLFLQYHIQNKNAFSKTLNLGIALAYRKRYFELMDLKNTTDKRLFYQDFLSGKNQTTVDISTVVSGIQGNMLIVNTPFGNNQITINITPTVEVDIASLPLNVQKHIQLSKVNTGNTFNDVNVGIHPYDFKHKEIPKFGKSHIYFYDYENIDSWVDRGFNLMLKTFYGRSKNIGLDQEYRNYANYCYKNLQIILNNDQKNAKEKLDAWNLFLTKNLDTRPKNFSVPILVQTTQKPFASEEYIENPYIPNIVGPVDDVKIFNALTVAISMEIPLVQHKAYVATKGVLGKKDPACEIKTSKAKNKPDTGSNNSADEPD